MTAEWWVEHFHEACLKAIEGLMFADLPIKTPAGAALLVLVNAVERYEKEKFPF